MEQVQQLNEAVNALGNLQEILGNIDLSQMKVAMKIKERIANLKEELKNDVIDSEYFTNYNVKTKPEDIYQNPKVFCHDRLFREALETFSWSGKINVEELDIYSVEEIVNAVNDLSQTVSRTLRKIRDLEELLN